MRVSELLQHLQAYIPGDRRRALARGEAMPDRVHGAALFADISGFTPLTEALSAELGAHRGAEELTKHLNRVFHALIEELHRFGGEVIYFSGDAITCWFDGDDGARATACGLAMQETMRGLHDVVTPRGTRVTLAMKAAIAVGPARRFVVGDPDVQLIDVLAGRLIDALATAEHHAVPGEVILDQSALDALRDRIVVGDVRHDHSSREYATVVRTLTQVPELATPEGPEALAEDVARRWVLPALYERLRTGSGEFLTELRPAYPLFARFGGIDYDDDAAPAKLDEFVRHVQRIFAAYGGNLVHLSVGDKGAYLYGVFGSPQAHEDDAARALAAALELRELPKVTAVSELQIGITYGRLRSGMYGHEHRQAFTCLGDAVNLAARLMSHAPHGQILVSSAVHDAAREKFAWNALEPIHVKGKREPVQPYALTASVKRAQRSEAATSELPMIGRAVELNLLTAGLDAALAGNGSVIGIAADAGMGKSRLIAEFARQARTRGILVATGECQAFGSNTSYFAWREIWQHAVRPRRCIARRGQGAQGRGRARGDRPRAGPARAAAFCRARRADRGQRSHRCVRREAPQDLARGTARRLSSCPHRRGAAGRGARGLPLARSAVARPAGGARASVARTQVPVRGCLSAGERARRRPWPREAGVTFRRSR